MTFPTEPDMAEIQQKISDYVEAAYLHGLPTENLDTGELEPPKDIADTAWITDSIMNLLASARKSGYQRAVEDMRRSLPKTVDTSRTFFGTTKHHIEGRNACIAAMEEVLGRMEAK